MGGPGIDPRHTKAFTPCRTCAATLFSVIYTINQFGVSSILSRSRFAFALCADDYAMTPGVSRGILEAIEAERLTATSVMTTSRWWPDAAVALKGHRDHVDVGLHLNLTLGEPLKPMPRFARSGEMPSIGALLRGVRQNSLPLDELAEEIDRQFDSFVARFEQPPDHVDGHQHVHVLGPVREIVFSALDRRGWRPWLRNSGDRPTRILRRRSSPSKALGVAWLARGFAQDAAARGLSTNDGFAGYSAFCERTDYRQSFDRYLAAPGGRHLVMCHPGYVDDALRRIDPVLGTREQELAFLLSSRFHDVLAQHGAALCRLSREVRAAG